MNLEELFVGCVAVLLGAVGLIAAIANWDVFFQFSKVRWIESIGGRRLARAFFALVGALLIALGFAIAGGFGPNKSRSPRTAPAPQRRTARRSEPSGCGFDGQRTTSSLRPALSGLPHAHRAAGSALLHECDVVIGS